MCLKNLCFHWKSWRVEFYGWKNTRYWFRNFRIFFSQKLSLLVCFMELMWFKIMTMTAWCCLVYIKTIKHACTPENVFAIIVGILLRECKILRWESRLAIKLIGFVILKIQKFRIFPKEMFVQTALTIGYDHLAKCWTKLYRQTCLKWLVIFCFVRQIFKHALYEVCKQAINNASCIWS